MTFHDFVIIMISVTGFLMGLYSLLLCELRKSKKKGSKPRRKPRL